MKSSTKYLSGMIFSVTVSAIVFITVWLYLENEKEKYNSLITSFNKNYSDLQISDSHRQQELYYNGKELLSAVELSDSATAELRSIVDGNKLVLVISETNCEMCVQAELQHIADSIKQLKDKVILLVKSDKKRYVSQIRTNNKITYPCIHVKKVIGTTVLEPPPFYFVLEEGNLRMNAVFTPQKDKPKETARYFAKVIADYFQQEE